MRRETRPRSPNHLGSGVGSHLVGGAERRERGAAGARCGQEMGNSLVRGQVVSRAGWVRLVSLWRSIEGIEEGTARSANGRGASSERKPIRRQEIRDREEDRK